MGGEEDAVLIVTCGVGREVVWSFLAIAVAAASHVHCYQKENRAAQKRQVSLFFPATDSAKSQKQYFTCFVISVSFRST
jgi:hypothetical protein